MKLVKFILLLVIAAALLWFAFRPPESFQGSFGDYILSIFKEMLEAKVGWLLLSVAASLVAFVSRAYRWNMLLHPLGFRPPLKSTWYALMIGYFANLAFPRLGEVTRCGTLSKAEKVPFNVLLGTVILERMIDVLCLLICLLITAVMEYDRLGNFMMENIVNPAVEKAAYLSSLPIFWAIVASLLVLIFLASVYYRRKQRLASSGQVESGHVSPLVKLIRELIAGLRSIGKLERPGAFLFHTILIWGMYFLMAYLCFFSLPVTAGLGAGAGMFVLVAGGIGMSAPVQGGFGAYHILVSEGLALFGLSRQDGLAFATLLHTSQIIVVMILGSLSLLLLFSIKKRASQ